MELPEETKVSFIPFTSANIALNKPAKQSSSYSNSAKYGPGYANDGKIEEQNKGGEFIMCTQKENNPWWEVDLLSTYTIKEIRLHNRINGDIPATQLIPKIPIFVSHQIPGPCEVLPLAAFPFLF